MILTNVLNWDDPSQGILLSGWSPFTTGSFSFKEEFSLNRSRVVMIYEDLRPGALACCLFAFPPVVAFAPIFCPLLSASSKAYHFSFDINSQSQCCDLSMREKSFACGGEKLRTFPSLRNIRLETVHKVYTSADMTGWSSSTKSSSSVTVHTVVLDYKDGSFALPPLPQDDFFILKGFVASVLRLLQNTPCYCEMGLSMDAENPISVGVLVETCQVIVPEAGPFSNNKEVNALSIMEKEDEKPAAVVSASIVKS